jgi:hypothetical protein
MGDARKHIVAHYRLWYLERPTHYRLWVLTHE